jgi:hypothetical protein
LVRDLNAPQDGSYQLVNSAAVPSLWTLSPVVKTVASGRASIRAAVWNFPGVSLAMSPAPTITGSDGGAEPVVMTSCGAVAPASRESYSAPSELVEVPPML